MQFSVPQFVEVEDKIIGPLTLKQFFILLGGAFIVFALYKLISNFLLFILAALPFGGLAVVAAFGKFNGQPFGKVAVAAIGFLSEPRSFVFRKGAGVPSGIVRTTKISKPSKPTSSSESPTERLNRLRKLTYILDQNIQSEKELIKEKFVNLR